MFTFDDKIQFTKAIYHHFHPIRLPRTFKDATGGFGNFAPLQGWIQLFDSEGFCGQTFCTREKTVFLQSICPFQIFS